MMNKMEYPFKDLMPLDEVTARDGYYKDWTHIDADTFHQISELVKFIREKGYGADTREAIAQALERVYHDAAQSGNANMEVSMARGRFDTLGERLNETTAQLAQKADKGNVSVNDININLGKFDGSYFSDDFLTSLNGGELDVTNILPRSVTHDKIENDSILKRHVSFLKNNNLFNGYLNDNIIVDTHRGITRSDIVTKDQVNTAVIDIEPYTEYRVWTSGGTNNKWRIAVMNEPINLETVPVYDGTDTENTIIKADRNVLTWNDSLNDTTFVNTDGKQMFVYVSTENERPILNVEKTGDALEFTAPISSKNITEKSFSNKSVPAGAVSFIDNINLFNGYLKDNIVIANGGIHHNPNFSPDKISTAVIDIKQNTSYKVWLPGGEETSRWVIAVMNEPLDLANIPTYEDEPSIPVDRIVVNNNNMNDTTFFNADGKQMIVYVSHEGERPHLAVEELELKFNRPINAEYINGGTISALKQNVFLDSVSEYDSSDLPSGRYGFKSSEIYNMFDDLVSAFPNYVSKILLGNEPTSNLPIYEYRFTPRVIGSGRDNPTGSNVRLPKILLTGGIHGTEKQGPWAILKFVEDMCYNWGSNNTLEFFRHNIDFRIIPIINPWGFDENFRHNSAGLDLNREFAKDVNDMQPEARIIKKFIDENMDAEFYIDCHTMWAGRDRNIAWVLSPEGHLDSMSHSVISKLTRKWKKQYEFIEYEGLLGYVGEPEYDIPRPESQSRVYAYNQGLKNSVTLELAAPVDYSNESISSGEITINMYVDFLGNFLVACATHLGASYK